MNIASAVVLGLLAALVIYAVVAYNGLVGLKHGVARAWSNIDVLLRQRHDELPKLVETCRQYQQFEAATLARVTEARASIATAREQQNLPALGAAEGQLRAGLGRIFAVAEAYPELRANEQFMQLQARISALENGIADRRELYNEAVNLHRRPKPNAFRVRCSWCTAAAGHTVSITRSLTRRTTCRTRTSRGLALTVRYNRVGLKYASNKTPRQATTRYAVPNSSSTHFPGRRSA